MEQWDAGDPVICACGNDHKLSTEEAAKLNRGESIEYRCTGDTQGPHRTRLWLDEQGQPRSQILQ